MNSLKLVAIGILVVAVDLNLGSFDLLFDPVGYLLVVLGLSRVADVHPWFGHARWAAVVGLLASIAGAVLRRTETFTQGAGSVTSTTTTVVENPFTSSVESIAQMVVAFGICTALIALSREQRVVGPARTLRWALPGVTLLGWLLSIAVTQLDGATIEDNAMAFASLVGAIAIVLVIVTLVLAIWFLIVLFRASREPIP
ncbi:hypothetical protein ACQBAT_07675 [Ornithinimicrobium sp. Y1847]|uniref:hypothetical protein n=1 Tax=unclassified Ornithinimicrobium TaxID=2615080 RepID=UPI003B66E0E6